jgi:hypothetical protein
MLTTTDRRYTWLVIMVILVWTSAACGSPAATSTASVNPTAATAASTASGPMTRDELEWLDGVIALHKTMDKILVESSLVLRPTTLHSLAEHLAGCTAALGRLGPPTDRLRPVFDLAQQGCGHYTKAADCFTTAANLDIVVAGSPAEQTFNDAIDCGFAAPGEGSKLLADAEITGINIRNTP